MAFVYPEMYDKANRSPSGDSAEVETTLTGGPLGGQLGVWHGEIRYSIPAFTVDPIHGGFYYLIQDKCLGKIPALNLDWWQPCCGAGAILVDHTYLGEWIPDETYTINQLVAHDGLIYKFLGGDDDTIPGTDPLIWEPYVVASPVQERNQILRALVPMSNSPAFNIIVATSIGSPNFQYESSYFPPTLGASLAEFRENGNIKIFLNGVELNKWREVWWYSPDSFYIVEPGYFDPGDDITIRWFE